MGGGIRFRAHAALDAMVRPPFILCYHRVTHREHDPQLLAVSPENFAQQLEVLARYGKATPLRTLVRQLHHRTLRRRSFVITFDDGYADNLLQARPLLERADVPATVFVTTGRLGGELWWDELESIVLGAANLPGDLSLEIDGEIRSWKLEPASSPEQSWNVLQPPSTCRQHLYCELHSLLRPLRPDARDMLIDALRVWATVRPPNAGARLLDVDQIRLLAAEGLIEVGAHTHRHPVLAQLDIAHQRKEVVQSKGILENLLGERVVSFGYPYGGTSDYSLATASIVREAGFESACTTVPGAVRRTSSVWQLPRFLVRDWNGDEFERRLQRSFRG